MAEEEEEEEEEEEVGRSGGRVGWREGGLTGGRGWTHAVLALLAALGARGSARVVIVVGRTSAATPVIVATVLATGL
jgi:hypothetical protein